MSVGGSDARVRVAPYLPGQGPSVTFDLYRGVVYRDTGEVVARWSAEEYVPGLAVRQASSRLRPFAEAADICAFIMADTVEEYDPAFWREYGEVIESQLAHLAEHGETEEA